MVQNKKTVAELKNELYIATLIEKHQNDNLWLTKTMKDAHEAQRASTIENAKKSEYIKDIADILKTFDKKITPIFKEEDLRLYLLLKYSISNVEHSKLSDQELSCAKGMILEEIEFNPEQFSIEDVAECLKEKFTSPVFVNEKIKDIVVDICKNGVRCFEPFSHLLNHSERIVSSFEYAVVFKCLYSFILTDSEKEEVKSMFNLEYVSKEGKSWKEQMTALKQHHEDEKKAAEAYVLQNRIHIVDGIEKGISSIPSIWQYANQEKYASVLLSFSNKRNSTIGVSPNMIFNIDAIRDHVDKNGYIVVLFDKDFIDTIRPVSTVFADKLAEFKDSLVKHSELDAYIPDSGLWEMDVYILKKGKDDKNVHVFYNVDNMKQTDYLHYGNDFLQCRIMTQEDLAAIGYDLSKANMLPTIHANQGESFLPLSDLLEASKDEYVRLKQTAFGKIFSPDNYATSFDTFVVSPASLREAQVDDKWKKVSEPVFVIRQKPFAVAYVEASADQPVFFKEMTMTFSVKKDVVDPKYLYLLSTNGKLEQVVSDCPNLQFPFDGYTLYTDDCGVAHCGFWPAKDLLCYKGLIAIPNKEEQLRLVSDSVISQMHENLESSFENFKKEIHRRKHALTPIVSDIQKRWNVLQKYIKKNDGVIRLDDSIGIENPIPVSVWNNQISHDLEILTNRTKRLADEPAEIGAEYGTACSFSMQDFITQYVESHRPDGYGILVDDSIGKCSNLFFSKSGLERIFDNIIRNAISHGFEPSRNNIVLLKACQNDDYVVLSVCNNGLPISKGLTEDDILSWGRSTNLGENGHEGIGGNEIKNIIKFYGGKVNILSTPQDEYTVEYQLHIPQSYE